MEMIAVPTVSGHFCSHFGGAKQFLICRADSESGMIHGAETLSAPPHKPGALPKWLSERGVNSVLVGQIGPRAQKMLSRLNIRVVGCGEGMDPVEMVTAYLEGRMTAAPVSCEGSGNGHGHGHDHQCGGGNGMGRSHQ